MKIFLYCTFNDLFFTGDGFTDNFMECMFFNSVAVALSDLHMFLDANSDFDLEEFVLYVKCEVY